MRTYMHTHTSTHTHTHTHTHTGTGTELRNTDWAIGLVVNTGLFKYMFSLFTFFIVSLNYVSLMLCI